MKEFFAPLKPVEIRFRLGKGWDWENYKAFVDFSTHEEAVEAMKKHRTDFGEFITLLCYTKAHLVFANSSTNVRFGCEYQSFYANFQIMSEHLRKKSQKIHFYFVTLFYRHFNRKMCLTT